MGLDGATPTRYLRVDMPVTYVSLADAARDLGLASSTLRHQIRLRRLMATKIGRGWYVTPSEIEEYRERHLRKTA